MKQWNAFARLSPPVSLITIFSEAYRATGLESTSRKSMECINEYHILKATWDCPGFSPQDACDDYKSHTLPVVRRSLWIIKGTSEACVVVTVWSEAFFILCGLCKNLNGWTFRQNAWAASQKEILSFLSQILCVYTPISYEYTRPLIATLIS